MKNSFKISSVLSITLISITLLIGCNNKKINIKQDNNTVIVGYDNTFVPMGYLDDDNKPSGFDVDLAKEVFSRLNINVEFQNIDWAMKDTELNSGNVDLLWNGYTLTDDRKKKVDYSDAYLTNRQVIVTLKSSSIHDKSDLKSKTLGTQQDSSGFDAIEKDTDLVNSLKNKSPILYDSFDNAFRDLEYGRVDAVVADEVLAKYYIKNSNKTNFTILNDNFGKESFVVGFKKGNTKLRDKVNSTLKDIKSDKTFNKIYNKWFN